MTLTLRVDGDRWRAHLRSALEDSPGLVPVAKGNGYGFGLHRLARRAGWLGVDTLAVGTYAEVPDALSRFDRDVLVLAPWRPFLPEAVEAVGERRVIHTVGRVDDVAALAEQARSVGGRVRVVVEGLTAMNRHGLNRHQLAAAADQLRGLRLAGFALHLPMAGDRLAEAEQWAAVLSASRLDTTTMYVSHLTRDELAELRDRRRQLTWRPRVGTGLWLGDRGALAARATVLDRHRVSRGERVGYRQRPVPRDGWLLVVSGGTAHGIGLEAPTAATTVRQRAVTLARGGLDAAGFALSPFTVAGRQRWFAEPPHMQVSLLFVSAGVDDVPAVGDEVGLDVRFTTTTFDRVEIS